ncbi:Uncharacterised protein [Raoultella terrigena]|uniref:Uncharacterized protein n=1 Tax=Raoultella terrigena TaxID=577 RepID=A0A7Z8ZBW5_RAOTE|nr:Uncharacterised protein [Raoultella terrigena]VUC79877.1 Uncharacterised protein [Raoultella terrigena]
MGIGVIIIVVNAQADAQTYQLDGEVKAHHGDDGELGIMPEISTGHHNPIPLPWDPYGYRAVIIYPWYFFPP